MEENIQVSDFSHSFYFTSLAASKLPTTKMFTTAQVYVQSIKWQHHHKTQFEILLCRSESLHITGTTFSQTPAYHFMFQTTGKHCEALTVNYRRAARSCSQSALTELLWRGESEAPTRHCQTFCSITLELHQEETHLVPAIFFTL